MRPAAADRSRLNGGALMEMLNNVSVVSIYVPGKDFIYFFASFHLLSVCIDLLRLFPKPSFISL